MMKEKAQTGRLYSHIKHIEMRNNIRKIRKQEGTLEEDLTFEEKVHEIMKDAK